MCVELSVYFYMKLLWQQIASPVITKIFCNSDFDGVVLDCEHGIFNDESLFTSIQLINAHGKSSFVRFPELDKARVRLCLDSGVSGCIFSTVKSGHEANKVYNWCKYPKGDSHGFRGQGLVCENGWGKNLDKLQSNDVILIGQIEDESGILNVKDISRWFDYLMIGPYDLSANLGSVGDWEHPNYVNAIKRFHKVVPEQERGVHLVNNIEDEYKSKFSNYGIVALGMDTTFLLRGIEIVSDFMKTDV